MVSNYPEEQLMYYANCTYDPQIHPNCPIFVLGNIIKLTTNANASFAEIAKFGATISMSINWNCYMKGWLWWTDPESLYKCNPEYSFRRIDRQQDKPIPGYYSYRYASFDESRKLRNHYRTYRIKIVTEVNARVYSNDFFKLLTSILAYNALFNPTVYFLAYYLIFKYIYFNNEFREDFDHLISVVGHNQEGKQISELINTEDNEKIPIIRRNIRRYDAMDQILMHNSI